MGTSVSLHLSVRLTRSRDSSPTHSDKILQPTLGLYSESFLAMMLNAIKLFTRCSYRARINATFVRCSLGDLGGGLTAADPSHFGGVASGIFYT